MSELSFFLGCIAPNRYPGIEKATKLVMEELGVHLMELKGASCCPAPGVFRSFDELTWLTIASRNIVLSEEMGVDILTVCNGCFGSLADANNMLKENPELRNEVNKALAEIGREFKGTIRARHIMEYLHDDIGVRKVKESVRYPIDLKVAVHYGCHLIKPSKERHLGSVENPRFFDELVEATGATSVPYKDKNACCGAGGGVRTADLDTSLLFTRAKLEHARDAGADCIVDSCPFCHLQMDAGQIYIEKKFGDIFNNGSPRATHRHHRPQGRGLMPIIHYSQLLGLGMGYTPQELGIDMNYVRNDEFIRTIEKIA